MPNDAAYHRLAIRIFVDFGVSIAVPAVLAAFLGQWLDQRYGTSPRYLILCVAVALILTAVSVAKKAKMYGREYEKLMKPPEQKPPNV
jgi:F0F1-type ATP synthase assembly protein I